MSDHIAHIAICDDVFRLANLHPGIHDTFKRLFSAKRESAHMGTVTRSADKWSAEILAAGRDALAAGEGGDPLAEDKIAFVLGALTHRSADRLTKPITACWKEEGGKPLASRAKIYHDVFIFREVYGSGRGEHAAPFEWVTLVNPMDDTDRAFETLYRVMLRRALIGMHTLNPDKQHIDDWLNAFFTGLQTFPKSLRDYADINAKWDPAEVKKFIIDGHYYVREDEMIVLARKVQRGETVTTEQLLAALDFDPETDQSQSRYARALAKATDYLLAASELFDGKIGIDEAKKRFDVGVPELSLG